MHLTTQMKVKSEPNIIQIFVILGAGGLFFILLGTFIAFTVAPDYPLDKQLGLTAVGLGLYVFAIASSISYFKSTPEVVVTLEEVRIKHIYKSETINTDEISEVLLNQKSPYKFLFVRMQIESTIVVLKDGSSRIFWDFFYDEFSRVKNALNLSIDPNKYQKIEELQTKKKAISKPIDKKELATESFIDFKGNRMFNFHGLLLAAMASIFLYRMTEENMIRGIVIFTILLGVFGYHLHYFRLSDKYLQVRNFIWFWKSKTFRIEDIHEIIHEHPSGTPESLRIRLKNFQTSSIQPAGSYRRKHWIELFKHLKRLNVKIRSEYYDETTPQ